MYGLNDIRIIGIQLQYNYMNVKIDVIYVWSVTAFHHDWWYIINTRL